MKYVFLALVLTVGAASAWAGEGETCYKTDCRNGDLYYGYRIPNGNLEIGFCSYTLIEKHSSRCVQPESHPQREPKGGPNGG